MVGRGRWEIETISQTFHNQTNCLFPIIYEYIWYVVVTNLYEQLRFSNSFLDI